MRTLIYNVRLAGREIASSWILVHDEFIEKVGENRPYPQADIMVDGKECLALPGIIDCHVHFREPGLTDKADIATESRAAVAGGVTSYLEMPNTVPQTTTVALWEEKMQLAAEKSTANYGFFIGATSNNIDQLIAADYTCVPGVKLFMGASTGNMLVDDDSSIARLFREVDAIVAVHAEDQQIIARNTKLVKELAGAAGDAPIELHTLIRSTSACYNATRRAVELSKKFGRRLHICHITTAAELSLLEPGDPATKLITSEVSPHHLMWCVENYSDQGSMIKMNPAVKESYDREALRQALKSGLIDIVATDHAPHKLSEKEGGALKAVSGAPLVQFSLPWMLQHFSDTTVQRVMCENPAKVYHIDRRGALKEGYYADITLVEKTEPYNVSQEDVLSKCGWTPLDHQCLSFRIRHTWVNGNHAYDNGVFAATKAAMPLRFRPQPPCPL